MQARDPIPQFAKFMLAQGLASEAEIKEIEAKVAEQVEDCVEFADASPKPVRLAGWSACWLAGWLCRLPVQRKLGCALVDVCWGWLRLWLLGTWGWPDLEVWGCLLGCRQLAAGTSCPPALALTTPPLPPPLLPPAAPAPAPAGHEPAA